MDGTSYALILCGKIFSLERIIELPPLLRDNLKKRKGFAPVNCDLKHERGRLL